MPGLSSPVWTSPLDLYFTETQDPHATSGGSNGSVFNTPAYLTIEASGRSIHDVHGSNHLSQVDTSITTPIVPSTPFETLEKHTWVQSSLVTTTSALNHLVVERTSGGLKWFCCGWEGCTHPVGFTKKACLIVHIRSVHLREKPFQCTKCGMFFGRKQEAIRHVNTMNGGKVYRCSAWAFSRKYVRDDHEDQCLFPSDITPQAEA